MKQEGGRQDTACKGEARNVKEGKAVMKRYSRETGFGEPENPVNKLRKHPLSVSQDPKLMETPELLGKNTWTTFQVEF